MGQSEDCSPGKAPEIVLRNCSKEAVLGGGGQWAVVEGRGQPICYFAEGRVHLIKYLSLQKFSASHKELMLP